MSKTKYSVSRAIEGVTLNGDEYLLTELGNVQVFDSIQEIEEALGIKEEDFDDAGITVHEEDTEAWDKRCKAVETLHELGYKCVVLWHVNDVITFAALNNRDINAEKATEILDNIERNYDAEIGVTWLTILSEIDIIDENKS